MWYFSCSRTKCLFEPWTVNSFSSGLKWVTLSYQHSTHLGHRCLLQHCPLVDVFESLEGRFQWHQGELLGKCLFLGKLMVQCDVSAPSQTLVGWALSWASGHQQPPDEHEQPLCGGDSHGCSTKGFKCKSNTFSKWTGEPNSCLWGQILIFDWWMNLSGTPLVMCFDLLFVFIHMVLQTVFASGETLWEASLSQVLL